MESLDDSTNILTYFQNIGSFFSVKLDHYKDIIFKLQNELGVVKENYNVAQDAVESASKLLDEKDVHIASLEANIKRLEDEKNAFSRVSQIIAMEKENTRLKADLEFMNQRLNKLTTIKGDENHASPEENSPKSQEPVYKKKIKGEEKTYIYQINDVGSKIGYLQSIVDKDNNKEKLKAVRDDALTKVITKANEEQLESSTQSQEQVYKKKIKGTYYFIGEETKNIYQINDDEQVGSKIGYLQTIVDKDNKEKLKVIWD